jgi:hypothetical protein
VLIRNGDGTYTICASHGDALKHLRGLIEKKLGAAIAEVDNWRQKLAAIDAQIAGVTGAQEVP